MAEVSTSQVLDAQLFRDAFNASPIGIALENLDGQPLFVNPAFCSFLGFTEKELRGKHCVDFSPAQDAEKDWALFQQLKAGSIDHYQMEKRYFRRDGSLVWGRLSISLLKGHSSPLVLAMVEDITEKKTAEEMRFRHAAVIESSEDAIATGNLDGTIVTWNAGAQKMYGYTESEAVGKPITMLHPPELKDEENKILQTLRAGGRIEHFETIRVTKTGKRINISLTISPIKDSSGKTVGISGIARDITERKRTEEALRASEGRLRLAQQAARIATFERDVRTGRVTWAEGLDSLYGMPPGSLDGQTLAFFNDLVHPADRERTAHLIQDALKTGQPTEGEWRAIWPDGSVHWIAGRWQVLMDASGEASRVVGVNMDVTERKLAEDALRESEEQFRSVFSDAGVGMVIVSPGGRFLAANKAFCDLLGYTEEELLETTVESVTFSEDWPAFSNMLQEALTERRGFQWFEKRCLHKSGQIVYTESSACLIRGHEGQPRYFVGQVLDVTHRKQAEEALSGMTRKLVEAQEHERARIARELHDDINQRLALLSVELEASRQKLPDTATDVSILLTELRKRINEISADVQSISHQLHSSQLEYLGIVGAARSFCREFSASQNVQIDFNHDDIPRPVSSEISLCLFRVLQEALHNAVKYSKVRHFEVRLSCSENQLSLTVSDRGVGFDPESALIREGLGLTSMKERVRLINGTISIESKPMHGTTIGVRVPLQLEHDSEKLAG